MKTTKLYIVNHFKETAVHASTYGGVRGRQRLIPLPPTLIHLDESRRNKCVYNLNGCHAEGICTQITVVIQNRFAYRPLRGDKLEIEDTHIFAK